MTSKISCFDGALFRRALKKTAPVWSLFALYELLLPFGLLSNAQHFDRYSMEFACYQTRSILETGVTGASVVACIYGGILAWALFSWLFRANSAYFHAALPIRRETLFLTNYLTGLLLCAVPALLSALGTGLFGLLAADRASISAVAGSVLLPALQAAGATLLGFVCFFSFGVLVCTVIGQTAAVLIVYTIANFAAYVLASIVQLLLCAFVYGMPRSQTDALTRIAIRMSPVLGLMDGGFRVKTDYALLASTGYYVDTDPRLVGWVYLGLLAAVGVLFAVCAFFLLKTREMERSGDVIAVGWLRPVALYVFTIGCALVLGELMLTLFPSSTSNNFWYVLLFLILGAFIGYFFAQMLLQKTIRVFKTGWLGYGACCLVLILAFGTAKFDLFGYSCRLPARAEIAAAGLTVSQYDSSTYTTDDAAFISDVLALHTALVEEKSAQEARRSALTLGTDMTQAFYITYRMTDGSVLQRYYDIVYTDAELEQPDSLIARFESLYNSPTGVRVRTGFDKPYTQENILGCTVTYNSTGQSTILAAQDAWKLYTACVQDIDNGRLGAEDVRFNAKEAMKDSDFTPLWLQFTVETGRGTQTLYVDAIPLTASSTVAALTGLGFDVYWPGAEG